MNVASGRSNDSSSNGVPGIAIVDMVPTNHKETPLSTGRTTDRKTTSTQRTQGNALATADNNT